MRIYVAGIGPGSAEDITPALQQAVADSNVVVGYKYYFQFIEKFISDDTVCIDTGMKKERQRAEMAFEYAEKGNTVCVVSSGDAGIYGMAPLIYEMKREKESKVEIVSIPGISAFQKAASLLGAPMGHDFCVISMSDLMTPWHVIEKRIVAAAEADFITAVYNPKSNGRYWQLYRLKELFLKYRSEDNIVGYVRQAGREEQSVKITTLKDFNPEDIDMFTVVIIGNSQSYNWNGSFITPRGYYRKDKEDEDCKVGQSIMIKSFRTIRNELKNRDIPTWKLWPLLHYRVPSVSHWLHPRAIERAKEKNLTRAQAGIRLASQEHPNALYAFGNAPTALLELCSLVRKQICRPAGIVGAPVGFVHVEESKHAAKALTDIPKIIIDGRKGGSNLAATLINSILTFDDAEQLRPGRDV